MSIGPPLYFYTGVTFTLYTVPLVFSKRKSFPSGDIKRSPYNFPPYAPLVHVSLIAGVDPTVRSIVSGRAEVDFRLIVPNS